MHDGIKVNPVYSMKILHVGKYTGADHLYFYIHVHLSKKIGNKLQTYCDGRFNGWNGGAFLYTLRSDGLPMATESYLLQLACKRLPVPEFGKEAPPTHIATMW